MKAGLTLYQFVTEIERSDLLNEKDYPKLFRVGDHPRLAAVTNSLFSEYKEGYEHLEKKYKSLTERNKGRPGRKATKEMRIGSFNSCYTLHIISNIDPSHTYACKVFRKNSGSINNIIGTSNEAQEVCDTIKEIINKANPLIGFDIVEVKVSLQNMQTTLDLTRFSKKKTPECPINKNKKNYRGRYCSLVINVSQLKEHLSSDDYFKITMKGKKYPCLIFYGESNDLQFLFYYEGVVLRTSIHANGNIDVKGGKSEEPGRLVVDFITSIIEKFSDNIITVGFRTIQIAERQTISKQGIDHEFLENLKKNKINPRSTVPVLKK